MPEEPKRRGLAWLLAAKAVCCGGLLLAATGTLSLGGLAGWRVDSGIVWFATAALALTLFYLWRRYRIERRSQEQPKRAKAPPGAT